MENGFAYTLVPNHQVNLSHWISDFTSLRDSHFTKQGPLKILGAFASKEPSFQNLINEVKSSFEFLSKKYVGDFGKQVSVTRLMLKKSFEESFKIINADDSFVTVFDKMAESIQTLNFKDCFVDVSQKRRRVDFNLAFDNDIFVSIARNVDLVDSDEVMFAISHKKENIVIDQMNLHRLINKIKELPEITNKAQTV